MPKQTDKQFDQACTVAIQPAFLSASLDGQVDLLKGNGYAW